MIQRTHDATLINRVLNDPAVFKWVSAPGIERLDFTDLAADPVNYLLTNEHGGFMCVPRGNGTYEVHTQFLPSIGGRAVWAAREAARFMFTETDCTKLISYVPLGNHRARRLVEAMGFDMTGRDGSWTYPSGETVPLDWYELTKDEWKCQQQR